MAPFLRISFNSYELGSLKAADEASQPFCAVKMKEALSTGRAGGWTPPILQSLATGNCQWGREFRARRQRQWKELSCSRTFEGSFSSLSSSPCPAHLAVQDSRNYPLPIAPPALATWNLLWSPELLVPPHWLFCQEWAPCRSSMCPSVPGPVLGTEDAAMLQG